MQQFNHTLHSTALMGYQVHSNLQVINASKEYHPSHTVGLLLPIR
jgi:hypothetical protein